MINIYRLARSDYLKLVPILALAFYIAFIPHQNYPYPVHLDEWKNLAHFQALIMAGDTTFSNPWQGDPLYANPEIGFHVFWAVFHKLSGISLLTIFRYFPGVIFMISVFSVYTLTKREGFGWEAALFTCLLPTTVGILGPAFMVPLAIGLLFIPLSLFIVLNFRSWWSYVVLCIFIFLLLSIHAVTAVGLVTVLIPYILLNLRGNFKHSLGITLALGIPFLIGFPWVLDMLIPTMKSLLVSQPLKPHVDIPTIISAYGYLPILFCLLGTVLLAIRRGKNNYGLILGLLALLLMLVTFFTFHYGLEIMYYRGLTWMMLMMGIIAGAGLMLVKKITLPRKLSTWLKAPFITQNIGNILCLVVIGLTLYLAIPLRQNTPYYHMIDEIDYQAFVWIEENVGNSYNKAILDPWKATAFTAITGKYIYTRIGERPLASDTEAYDFLNGGCSDTSFLKNNSISIVYTRESCNNPDLTEVRKYVYLLKEAQAQ